MSGPTLVGWRGIDASGDQVVPLVLQELAGIDCTVVGIDRPSLNVLVTANGKTYLVDIAACIAAVGAEVRKDLATAQAQVAVSNV